MREVIAEQLEHDTKDIIGARTVRGTAVECLLVGNEIVVGVVQVHTDCGQISIRVSGDKNDYQRVRVYEDGKLVESLLYRDGSVTYADEAANPQPPNAADPATL
jgi:hypothetical protein